MAENGVNSFYSLVKEGSPYFVDFNRYTLTSSDYYHIIIGTFGVYLIYFSICYAILRREPKRLAWCISLLNSFATTLLCLIYCTVKTITSNGLLNSSVNLSMIYGNDNISAITCTIFGIVNILDLFLGLIFYRQYLGILTTYIHHTLYIWLMYFLLTGNGFFISTPTPFSMTFIWCLIEEFPTFILALGSIFPSCRSDMLFGTSFFLLRLVYHTYLFLLMMRLNAYQPMLILFGLTFAMHVEWFRVWFKKYGMSYLNNDNKKNNNKKN